MLYGSIVDVLLCPRLNAVQEERVCELEAELSRVSEETVDQQSLLTTIAQDKETISRCGE